MNEAAESALSTSGDVELSVVVPILNERESLHPLLDELSNVIENACSVSQYEVIFVDDGSTDGSWDLISELSQSRSQVSGIKLARNFGHQYALKAGLDNAGGRAVISIDGDLQQPPHVIQKLYEKWKDGACVVNAVRTSTEQATPFKTWTSKLFYRYINLTSPTKIEAGAADFRLLDRKVVDQLIDLNEGELFLRGLVSWLGYEPETVSYEAEPRRFGESKYSTRKMLRFAAHGILSSSALPLRLVSWVGVCIAVLSFAYAAWVLLVRLLTDTQIKGWATTTFLILFLGGVIIAILGVIAEYLAKIYEATKNRPRYVIDKKT